MQVLRKRYWFLFAAGCVTGRSSMISRILRPVKKTHTFSYLLVSVTSDMRGQVF
jgi:hypothetical protein